MFDLLHDPETGLWSVWLDDTLLGLGATEAEARAEADEALELAACLAGIDCA